MKKTLLLFVGIISMKCAFSQVIGIEWQQTLGGNGFDRATSVQQTIDGGYIVAGISSSINGDVTGHHGDVFTFDCWIAKLSTKGDIQWQKSLGGSKNEGNVWGTAVYSVRQTSDGGYIVAGSSTSDDGDVTGHHESVDEEDNFDYWVVKLDNAGIIQWQKSLGGARNDHAFSVDQTTDGGYIIAGYAFSADGDITEHYGDEEDPLEDFWIIKLDNSGATQWQKSLGGSFQDQAFSIKQTSDNGYIIAGYSFSNDGDVTDNNGDSYWIVKLNSAGTTEWQKTLGGSGLDKAFAIRQTSDNGYIIAGTSDSNNGDVIGNHGKSDYWVVKLDALGAMEWQKSLGGTEEDIAYAVNQTTDGGYVVAGYSQSNNGDVSGNHGNNDMWIVKLDGAGVLQWQKALGGAQNDVAYSIQQTSDGRYIIAGWTSSSDGDITVHKGGVYDYWIVKLSSVALPVHLLSFEGSLQHSIAKLTWSTGVEERFKHFELEKSTGNMVFSKVAIVAAKGNNSKYLQQVSQIEESAYYRLKMVDKDGSFSYSNIIKLQQQVKQKIVLYPNPARNFIQIKIGVSCTAIIYSAAGVPVKHLTLRAGINNIGISSLSSGVYYLVADNQNLSFIKQ